MVRLFLIIFLLFSVTVANAQTDSPKAATEVIKVFYSGVSKTIEGLGEARLEPEITKRRDQALSDISSIRITESPGEKRFKKVYTVVETSAGKEIAVLRDLTRGYAAGEKAKAEEEIKKLTELRSDLLNELEKTLQYEISSEERMTPPPPISGPPFTSDRNESPAVPRME